MAEFLVAFAVGVAASIVGGAIGGMMTCGKALGIELAAMMGGFYGPISGLGGVLLGVALVALRQA